MARVRTRGNLGRSGSGLGLSIDWNWGDGFTVPDEIMRQGDKQKAADVMLDGVRSRAPVVTGKFRASLVSKVLKRTVNVRSKLRYMRKLNWDVGKKGKPFAYISADEQKKLELIAEQAVDRFLAGFQLNGG